MNNDIFIIRSRMAKLKLLLEAEMRLPKHQRKHAPKIKYRIATCTKWVNELEK